jgi:urease accessory protein
VVASARRALLARLAAVAAAAFAPLAAAHTGHGDSLDFLGGLLHPLTGLDHALAMFAVGVLAWTLGGPARWRLPAAFLAALTLGLGVGVTGVVPPQVETAVAASVGAMGAMLLAGRRLPATLALVLVGAFGVLHGSAHGAEIHASASMAHASGFFLATAGLHAAGLLLAAAVSARRSRPRRRTASRTSRAAPGR